MHEDERVGEILNHVAERLGEWHRFSQYGRDRIQVKRVNNEDQVKSVEQPGYRSLASRIHRYSLVIAYMRTQIYDMRRQPRSRTSRVEVAYQRPHEKAGTLRSLQENVCLKD